MPAYLVRVAIALFSLTLFSLPQALAAVAIASQTGGGGRRSLKAFLASIPLLLLGALAAATDARNTLGLNPIFYGAPFVALALPLVLWLAIPPSSPRRTSALVIGLMLVPPITLILAGFGSIPQRWAVVHGLPFAW